MAVSRHRRAVIGIWLLVLAVCGALYPSLEKVLSPPDYSVQGTQSAEVERLLDGPSFGAGSEQDSIVFFSTRARASDPAYRRVVGRVLRSIRAQPNVTSAVGPFARPGSPPAVSRDGRSAVAQVSLGGNARTRFRDAVALQRAVERASGDGVQAWLTGFSTVTHDLGEVEKRDAERAETLGLPVALLVLMLALGALAAAVVPLAIASSALLATFGVIALVARVLHLDAFLVTIVTMIGVGIGIDYSLFVVARFREELSRSTPNPRRERRRVHDAVGRAIATSGRTIVYSGAIVVLALTSLLVVKASTFREFVIGTFVSVVCTLLTSLTLLPALLAQLGPRINAGALPSRWQPSDAHERDGAGPAPWARWALAMMRRPLLVAGGVSALLVLAAMPAHGLRSGLNMGLPSLVGTPSGNAAQTLERSFSPGMLGPVQVIVGPADHGHGGKALAAATRQVERELRADRQVRQVAARRYPTATLLTAVPSVAVDSPAAEALVKRIRAGTASDAEARFGVRVLVGGWTAQAVDIGHETAGKLPLVLAITLALALVFLLVVFRSVVLPIKALAMNLLATGAALGLVVLIFQDGHGEGLLGFASPGYLQTFLPLCMFVLLFGLSMDYEVFLIRRMQESWEQLADNRLAVASGVEHTGRPISAAAAIMVAVFGSFLTANVLELKQFGFALAVAIAIDATLIRLVLVPALMCLLGERNWWLPRGLQRLLPRLDAH